MGGWYQPEVDPTERITCGAPIMHSSVSAQTSRKMPFIQSARSMAPGSRCRGASSYRVHFAKGMTPPVNGFWSLTMYEGSSAISFQIL